jgi:glycolate oxidase FAD binding subunit
MLPLDAPRPDRATIGGILAANTSGPRRLAYGTARDRLIGLRVVDAQSKLIKGGGKVVKNVAGFDLPKLFIGSLGTLGIIVEATFKLAPAPKARAALLAGFRELREALDAAHGLLKGGLRPAALDLLNAHAMRKIGLRTGVPAVSDRLYTLAIEFGSAPAAVERQKSDAHRLLAQAGGKSVVVGDAIECESLWRAIVELGHVDAAPVSMITRTSVRTSRLGGLVHGHEALAESSHLEVALDVHLAAGVLRAAWWGEAGGAGDEVMLGEAVGTLRKAAANAGGSFVVESCAPALKMSIDVWGTPGSEFAIMRRLKEQFDPGRILSPGRFVGGL